MLATLQTHESTPVRCAVRGARPEPAMPVRPIHSRVLMICQAFPPTGGPGVQRSAKFAKYLPRNGWQPVVWSATRLIQLPQDDSLLADLPADLIHRRSRPLTHASLHDGLMHGLRQIPLGKIWRERVLPRIDWRAKRGLRWLSSLPVPDECVAWASCSVLPLLRIIRQYKVKALYSTYSPVSNHVLALWLKQLTGLPWVADYRDLWVDDFCYHPRSRVRGWLEWRLQTRLLQAADAVIGVSRGQTDVLAGHVPGHMAKFFTLCNGVDLEDIARIERPVARARVHGPADRFVLTFAGLFVSSRTSAGFFEGLGRFARWVSGQHGAFEFRVVGGISEDMRARMRHECVPVSMAGYVPHREALEQMIAADALLLLVPTGPNTSGFMTGKVFEYLASQRPILLVGPQTGAAQQLIADFRAGISVSAESDAVFGALRDLWSDWHEGRTRFGCSPEQLTPFSREHLAGTLAEILDHVRRRQRASQVPRDGQAGY